MIERGEVWWASLRAPHGTEPGYRRPVVIVQADSFNRSRISTVVAAVITSNLDLARAPGNVRLTRRRGKLPRESVINFSQIITLDRDCLTERISRLPADAMSELDAGLQLVLGLPGPS